MTANLAGGAGEGDVATGVATIQNPDVRGSCQMPDEKMALFDRLRHGAGAL